MSEDELLIAYDTLRAEIFDQKKQLVKADNDLASNAQHIERSEAAIAAHLEAIENMFKAKIVSLNEFGFISREYRRFLATLRLNNETRRKLTKVKNQTKNQLPKMEGTLKNIALQLERIEAESTPKVLEFKRNDKRRS